MKRRVDKKILHKAYDRMNAYDKINAYNATTNNNADILKIKQSIIPSSSSLTIDLLQTLKLNKHQLKKLAKQEKLHVSGNYAILTNRIYSYLFIKQTIIKLQALARGKNVRSYFALHGSSILCRKQCNTDCDCVTLVEFNQQSIHRFISYECVLYPSVHFSFDIMTIYQLMMKNGKVISATNPFNREPIPPHVIENTKNIFKHYLFKQYIEDYAMSIFDHIQLITQFPIVSHLWFYTLRYSQLSQFLLLLFDTWSKRIYLTQHSINIFYQECKCNPFENITDILSVYNVSVIKIKILNIIECMTCVDNNHNIANSFLILGSLAAVCQDANYKLPIWVTNTFLY